ncbi:hypothetical protein AB4072_00920 [Microvirga sp. 2MCAF38]|uniref:hypothetical protein n=1 Tax=Microvirga sp. 2MCAF38 TaxID=3232989 RepID=UPI003F958170
MSLVKKRLRLVPLASIEDIDADPLHASKTRLKSVVDVDLAGADGAKMHEHLIAVQQLKEMILRRRPRCVTFDVFDTLLWRPARAPHHMFAGLGAALQDEGLLSSRIDPATFAEARRAAETRARDRKVARGEIWEVSLSEIYAELQACIDGAVEKAVAAEVEFERATTFLDPILSNLIQWIDAQGIKTAYVSDTYYSASQIFRLLHDKLPIQIAVRDIFVSSEKHVDKCRGLLAYVCNAYGCSTSSIMHFGDSHEADHIGAEIVGAFPIHIRQFKDLDRERVQLEDRLATVLGRDWSDEGLRVGIDPLRRHVSLAARGHIHSSSLASDLAFSTVGPVLAGFVEWVVTRAVELKIEKLFCLTREGLFLSELINLYAEHTKTRVLAVPFLSSRAVTYPTLFHNCDRDEFRTFFFSRRTPLTLRGFFERIESPKLVSEFPTQLRDLPLRNGSDETDAIIRTLSGSEKFHVPIREWARRQRTSLKRYVDAVAEAVELQRDTETVAFVDLGWTTKSQRVLEGALKEIGYNNPTIGLYLATDNNAKDEMARGTLSQGFLVNCGLPRNDSNLILRCKEIFEQVCSADVGSVKGYGEQGQVLFAPNSVHARQSRFLRNLRNGVRQFIKSYLVLRGDPQYRAAPTSISEMQPALRILLGRLTVMPTDPEIEELGAWDHEENNGSDGVERICDPYFRELVRYGTADQLNHLPAYWLFGLMKHHRPAMFESLLLKSIGYQAAGCERFCAARMYVTDSDGAVADLPADYFVSTDGRALSSVSFFTTEPVKLEWGNYGPDPSVFIERILISVRNCQNGNVKRKIHFRPKVTVPNSTPDVNGRIGIFQNDKARLELPAFKGPHEISIIVCLSTH